MNMENRISSCFFLSFFNIVSKDLRLSLSGVIFVRAEKKINSFICFRG